MNFRPAPRIRGNETIGQGQFTPGPWRAQYFEKPYSGVEILAHSNCMEIYHDFDKGVDVMQPFGEIEICTIPNDEPAEEISFNIELIKAAPELFNSLAEALEVLHWVASQSSVDSPVHDVTARAELAMARARGEEPEPPND